jgi:hypothetical protein
MYLQSLHDRADLPNTTCLDTLMLTGRYSARLDKVP